MTNPFDTMELDTDAPRRMPIVHPRSLEPMVDKDGKEAFLTLYSDDSERGRAFDRKASLDRIGRRQVKKTDLVDQQESDQIEKLVALTAEPWHIVGFDEQPIDLPCNSANARALYGNPKLVWLRDQAQMFTRDRANFLPSKVQSSSPAPESDSTSISPE